MVILRGKILFIVIVLFVLSSCRILNPSQMLRTGENYPYSDLSKVAPEREYLIAPNDLIEINISTNNGQFLITPQGGSSTSQTNAQKYLVEFDGMVNIPLLSRVKLSGLTIRESENFLKEKFSYYFKDPFVQVKVTNNRVVIFPGGQGGNAQVIKLENSNTTLFEALALAGGISNGKACHIKLIRGELQERKVYLIDLSKIDGLQKADIVLKANDIIYIEPIQRVPEQIVSNITPYLTLISTLAIIYALFR